MAPSRELDLAIRCCRFAFAGGEPPYSRHWCELDWSRFLRLARFHRIQGLLWRALNPNADRLPAGISENLAADARAIAANNLRAAIESSNLLEDFDKAGIPLLFLKGLTLGCLAYGNPSIKAAIDIDLLVPGDQLAEAGRLLEQRGYTLRIPAGPFTADRLSSWHRIRKESVWARREPRSEVDLHTRLSDTHQLIPSLSVQSPRQEVEVGSAISLPTLRTDELVAYLSVHGAWSAWFRLKWIADFAALVHGRTSGELQQLYRRSQELGASRCAAQAMLVSDALFGSLDSAPDLRRELRSLRAHRWLCRAALRQLAGTKEPVEPTSRPFGTALIHLSEFGLLPGVSAKLAEFVRQVRAAT